MMPQLRRSSRAYRLLRAGRNRSVLLSKGLRSVHPSTFVHRTARVQPDLVAEEYAFVGPRCVLCPGVTVGRYSMLAAGVTIVGDDHEWRSPGVPAQFAGRPQMSATTIGRDCWLGDGVTVMSGVSIGNGAVVAARAVVTKDVPAYEVWAGVPARRIGSRFDEHDRRRHEAMLIGPVLPPRHAEPKQGAAAAPSLGAPKPSAGIARDMGLEQRRHLCVVTTAHPLDDVRVYSKIVRSYLDAGWRVSWVGPDHSFFAGDKFRDPHVHYTLTPRPTGRRDRLRSPGRVRRAVRQVHDVDWWYAPDPDAAAVAEAAARRQGGRVVFDIHEEFHASMLDRWTGGRTVPAVRELVRRRVAATCSRCDLVVGVDNAVLRPYVGRDVPSFTVRNCAPSWFADPVRPVELTADGPVFFHGKALPGNGTPAVLAALRQVQGVHVALFPGRTEHDGPRYMSELDQELDTGGLRSRVVLLDAVSHRAMPAVLAACSVGLVAYGRDLGVGSLPNRLFEYMAAGMAVLVPEYAVEMTQIVAAERIGLTCDFEDPRDIARRLRELRDDPAEVEAMGRRARAAFLARHAWDSEFTRLLKATE